MPQLRLPKRLRRVTGMNPALTSRDIQIQIERFLADSLSGPGLARWAFEQFCYIEEELLFPEQEQEDTIEAVLDELMWGDSDPFVITKPAATALLARLTGDSAPEHGA